MAGSLNKVQLIGNLGKDPEIRRTQDGRPIANMSIATSESWTDKNSGEKREQTEWHRVVCFSEGLSKVIEQYCHKGSKVFIEGALKTRKYTDQAGVEKWTTEVVMQAYNSKLILLSPARNSGGARDDADSDYGARDEGARPKPSGPSSGGGKRGDMDDEIPSDGDVISNRPQGYHIAVAFAA